MPTCGAQGPASTELGHWRRPQAPGAASDTPGPSAGPLLHRRVVGEVAVGEEGVEFGLAEAGVAELLPDLVLRHPELAGGVDEALEDRGGEVLWWSCRVTSLQSSLLVLTVKVALHA